MTLWDVGKFLKNPTSEEPDLVKQVMCWRAHLTKVVSLTYVDSLKAILSGSTDGSARYIKFCQSAFSFCGRPRTDVIYFVLPKTFSENTCCSLPLES